MLLRICFLLLSLLFFGVARDPMPVATLAGHEGSVLGVAFSPDGSRLATSSRDNTVKLWDAKTWTLLTTLSHHTDNVFAVVYSPAGDALATCGGDKTIQLLDPGTGKVARVL